MEMSSKAMAELNPSICGQQGTISGITLIFPFVEQHVATALLKLGL